MRFISHKVWAEFIVLLDSIGKQGGGWLKSSHLSKAPAACRGGYGDMKERGILMSAPMVVATLREVDPKTQTRRVLRRQPSEHHWQFLPGYELKRSKNVTINERSAVKFSHSIPQNPRWDTALDWLLCPRGQPGDRLYVRENGWQRPERTAKMMREGADTWAPYYFDADGLTEQDVADFKAWGFKRRPSIHMPRWASRILLEVVSVRVEHLQDISEADALAEGVYDGRACQCADPLDFVRSCGNCGGRLIDAVDLYRTLWESINGPGSWAANPWVWVVEFKRISA